MADLNKEIAPSQFYEVMAFLDRYDYSLHDRDGDRAYYGGHSQRSLAELYDDERKGRTNE